MQSPGVNQYAAMPLRPLDASSPPTVPRFETAVVFDAKYADGTCTRIERVDKLAVCAGSGIKIRAACRVCGDDGFTDRSERSVACDRKP